MTDLIAALQEELRDLAKAEFVEQTPEDDDQDDIGGELEIVEWRAAALVKAPPTGAAGEGPVAQ